MAIAVRRQIALPPTGLVDDQLCKSDRAYHAEKSRDDQSGPSPAIRATSRVPCPKLARALEVIHGERLLRHSVAIPSPSAPALLE